MDRSSHCRRRPECRSLGPAHLVSREQRCDEHIEGGIKGRYVWRIDHGGRRYGGRIERGRGRRYFGRVQGARGKSLARVGYCCGRQMSSDLLSGRSIFALVCAVHSMLLGECGPVSEQLYTMSLPLSLSSLDVVHFLMATILNPLPPTRRPSWAWPMSRQAVASSTISRLPPITLSAYWETLSFQLSATRLSHSTCSFSSSCR
jgi:hypothetical protein